jgi:hypothetical protein
MSMEMIRAALGWCTLINWGLLLWWWLFIAFAHDWVYRMHGKWFRITPEQFSAIHYAGMAYFKMAVFMFNLVPYLALRIVG